MADLNVIIGADASAYNTTMQGVGQTAQSTAGQVSTAMNQTAASTEKLGQSAMSTSMKFQTMRSGLSAVRDGSLAFAVGGQRADMMLMAMGHHITTLVTETGSLGGAFSALGSSLLGVGGVILALTVAFEIYEKSVKGAGEESEHFATTADANKDVIKNLDSSYSKAVSDVFELTENIKLAKQGFISKNDVVKEYNDTLGKTMGSVNSLALAEKKLTDGADDYIKMMLYKAAAQTALKEASDKALEAAKQQLKPTSDFGSFFDKIPVQNMSGKDVKASQQNIQMSNESAKSDAVGKFTKDRDELLSIFKKFQDDAAKIAASHKWSFVNPGGDTSDDKTAYDKLVAQAADLKLKLENAVLANGKPTLIDSLNDQMLTTLQKIDDIKKKIDTMSTYGGKLELEDLGSKTPSNISGVTKDDAAMKGSLQDLQARIKGTIQLNQEINTSEAVQKQYNEDVKEGNLILKDVTKTIGQGLTSAFTAAINGTQSFLSAFGSFIEQLIVKIISAIAAAAILAALLTFTGLGALTGASSSFSSNFGTEFSALAGMGGGVSKHASGGIFTQAHAGIFGEAGPEAIVTPKHLQDFAGTSGSGSDLNISHTIRGADLTLWITRANKSKGRQT